MPVQPERTACPLLTPTPAALQVACWLGVADVDATLGEEGLAAEYETQRPQGLGLGAKFLPHSKVGRAGSTAGG